MYARNERVSIKNQGRIFIMKFLQSKKQSEIVYKYFEDKKHKGIHIWNSEKKCNAET